nr:hypothetical protein [Arthrobacter ipis]
MTHARGPISSTALVTSTQPDRLDRPRRRGNELLQLLEINAEPFAHGLHRRLKPAVQHQPYKVQPALAALILPEQRREHLLHEFIQQTADSGDLIGIHPAKLTDTRR